MEGRNNRILFLFSQIFLSGLAVYALSYDYSASIECLDNPLKPQYGGGIVGNPELNHGMKGWTTFGDAQIEQKVSKGGNNFIVAHHRNQPHDSFSQKFYLEKEKFYTFSAWLQVSEQDAEVAAIFKTQSGYEHAGWVDAKSGCWSMLKGGLTVNASGPADLYFESKNTSVEIWADSISLQPFSEKEWRSHQQLSIEKARKTSMKLVAVDAKGNPIPNATLSLTQTNGRFPFGCAISDQILYNTGYQNWFKSKFKYTVFENEMKWTNTESVRGRVDYSVPDAMLRFTAQNGISIRGHNVLWDDKMYVPGWAQYLSPKDLRFAVDDRVNSLVRRYTGKVISWDVVNENLHFNFYESVFGKYASAQLYSKVHGIDFATTLYLNEFNTIEEPGDGASSPDKYLGKIRELRFGGYNGPLGIGLQGHFRFPNLPYMRATIDKLASTGLPIWLSEVDVQSGPYQAAYLEEVLREGHGHPSVRGIIVWSAWRPQGCYRMCLTDNNFRNLPTGDVVDKLIREWGTYPKGGVTDSNGQFEARLFHGDYKVTVNHSNINGSSMVSKSFEVGPVDEAEKKIVVHVKVSA